MSERALNEARVTIHVCSSQVICLSYVCSSQVALRVIPLAFVVAGVRACAKGAGNNYFS